MHSIMEASTTVERLERKNNEHISHILKALNTVGRLVLERKEHLQTEMRQIALSAMVPGLTLRRLDSAHAAVCLRVEPGWGGSTTLADSGPSAPLASSTSRSSCPSPARLPNAQAHCSATSKARPGQAVQTVSSRGYSSHG